MKNVLIVDDNRTTIETVTPIIKTWGYNVDAAESFEDAIRFLEYQKYLLALIDIRLGDDKIGGLRLCEEIKNKKLQVRNIVVMSAYFDNVLEKKVLNVGVKECLNKPIDYDKLQQNFLPLTKDIGRKIYSLRVIDESGLYAYNYIDFLKTLVSLYDKLVVVLKEEYWDDLIRHDSRIYFPPPRTADELKFITINRSSPDKLDISGIGQAIHEIVKLIDPNERDKKKIEAQKLHLEFEKEKQELKEWKNNWEIRKDMNKFELRGKEMEIEEKKKQLEKMELENYIKRQDGISRTLDNIAKGAGLEERFTNIQIKQINGPLKNDVDKLHNSALKIKSLTEATKVSE